MHYMGLNEIREKFLSFFEEKGHLRAASAPLVPIGDNSLLLINSGMAPLKPYFTGEVVPPRSRMTTCQKCIRTPDIERVGKTSRHGTYFEMLGNFSFGDYFKQDATRFAWEFITQVMEIPVDKIWVSIYLDDDEAKDIWVNEVGVSADRIVRLGKEDNFWEIGAGPCGPCSEIYFDRGVDPKCTNPDCAVGCDCDRYVEFWNLVFTQFNNDGENNYTDLDQKNIDTGMGLERLACIMQGVDSLFDVDTVMNITKHISEIAGKTYNENEKTDVSLRVITDHIRSTTMMVCDGVIPSNEGRGYVLRRLLRRAARHGKLLGIKNAFLHDVCDTVIKESCGAYPELLEKEVYIKKIIAVEEQKFQLTIDAGLKILEDLMAHSSDKKVSGADCFKLYDTYGFPIDLTLEILEDNGFSTDLVEFDAEMQAQKDRARAARAQMGDLGWDQEDLGLDKSLSTEFVGYTQTETEANIIAIAVDGKLEDSLFAGQKGTIITDKTTFYAESGGQISDKGIITAEGFEFDVTSVKKTADGKVLHTGVVLSGVLSKEDTVCTKIDTKFRAKVARSHSTVHLLHKALKEVVGEHVNQAGSYVFDDGFRFDFTHFEGLTPAEIKAVEISVNEQILAGLDITMQEMGIEDARKAGATALFGEKYGEIVRVVKMGDFSTELCGGTHIDNTAKIGAFKIKSESSVASGVRRIEAVVAMAVLDLIDEKEAVIVNTADALKSNTKDVAIKAHAAMDNIKELQRQISSLTSKVANIQLASMINLSQDVKGVNVLAVKVEDANMETLRTMADNVKEQAPNMVGVLSSVVDGKINLIAVCGKDALTKGAHAGKIIKEVAALTGGGGGGKPDMATAGGKDPSKLEMALESVNNIVEKLLG
ncbi:MAG: alanine--tRNA ligase [Clostridia bacterium]